MGDKRESDEDRPPNQPEPPPFDPDLDLIGDMERARKSRPSNDPGETQQDSD